VPPNRRIDDPERAHLGARDGFRATVHRFGPTPALADLVRRYWMPVWSLPDGSTSAQRVLQYPVCQLVVAPSYALLVGPARGLSTRELTGSGWVLGAMLQPATAAVLLDGPVTEVVDGVLPLVDLHHVDGAALVDGVLAAVGDDPEDPSRQQAAVRAMEQGLSSLPPVDEEGLLVNAVVEYVENDTNVERVGQVCEKFAISERSLQRLTARRIGLSPKWLVQRRRLHEAAGLLASGESPDLAAVAARLGYADQAHLTRDFRTVTGVTPGEYANEPRDESD
jgi:AraC-like DNA-binding protein